jgi:competence ComEA-like helix-hairpin-helix protein
MRPTLVELNGGPAEVLEGLPGVGAKTAARIIAHRERFGPFGSATDLSRVKGMGQRRAERLWALFEPSPTDFESSSFHSVASYPSEDPRISAHELGLELMLTVLDSQAPPSVDSEAWDAESDRGFTRPRAETCDEPLRALQSRASDAPDVPTARSPRRRLSPVLWAGAAIALGAGVLTLTRWVTAQRDASVDQARIEVEAVRREVSELRQSTQGVSAAQQDFAERTHAQSAQIAALNARLESSEKELASVSASASAVGERVRKVDEKHDKLALRAAKLEDDLAWQKMSHSAQVGALRAKVDQAADRLEAMRSGEE